MQTFLPYPDFYLSARVLDRQRLGNQRREAITLLHGGWSNHPASEMWVGYKYHLAVYCAVMCEEWIKRGYRDNTLEKIKKEIEEIPYSPMPPWMGDERLHSGHRAALLYKDPVWYGQFGWVEQPSMSYFWPSSQYNEDPVGILHG